MQKIAVIDDDVYVGNMLDELLTREGYIVLRAYSGTEALLLLSTQRPDLVLLDLMLPGLSGEEVLPKIQDIPVIVLSAKAEMGDKVKLLIGGASDYITKPFDTRELLARITVQLRKAKAQINTVSDTHMLFFGDLVLDNDARSVTLNGEPVHLTKTEHAILKQLMQNPTRVVTKSRLLELISEDTLDCTESSLKVHIGNLRKKLRAISDVEYIDSVWGIGFKMHE
ncbi:response regulator transcription factor [Eubacteriales bacterium OttesenSCG-928-K08]|nr:response regulator transcription factor [Eubacteriales bacterium OttesenSCG-928-K08]